MTSGLDKIAQSYPLTVCDVGARGGVKDDLAAIASGVDYVLFEPDDAAAEELRHQDPAPYRSQTALNLALGRDAGEIDINLYRARGCSSAYEADPDRAALFGRADYYVNDGSVRVPASSLDRLVSQGELEAPAFLKLDVQGMEADIFAGAESCLEESVVGIRCEVSFFALYRDQPLFADIAQGLAEHGFWPMRWLEFHEWRRLTRAKYPDRADGPFPVSRGQMIHGDVLFLRMPEDLPANDQRDLVKLCHLGCVAACYEMFDHAAAAFERPGVRALVLEKTGVDPLSQLSDFSKRLDRRAGWERFVRRLSARMTRQRALRT